MIESVMQRDRQADGKIIKSSLGFGSEFEARRSARRDYQAREQDD
jgi:hypothetical protein